MGLRIHVGTLIRDAVSSIIVYPIIGSAVAVGAMVAVITMIVANTVQTAVDGPFIKGEYGFAGVEYVLNILNYVFGGVFTLEFLLKVFALGPRGIYDIGAQKMVNSVWGHASARPCCVTLTPRRT